MDISRRMRSIRPGSFRGRDLLDGLPAQAGAARSARGEACRLRRARGHRGRRVEGLRRDVAALPRPIRFAAPSSSCAISRPMPASRAAASSRPSPRTTPRPPRPVAQGGRPAAAQGAQAGRFHGRGRKRRARLHDLPGGAPRQAALDRLAGRLDGEAGRRTDVVGIFPDERSIIRLAGAILLEKSDKRAVQRTRYMSLGTIANIGDDPLAALSAMAAVWPARSSRGSRWRDGSYTTRRDTIQKRP